MRILCFVSEIDRLEKEVDASKAKIADLEQTNEKTLSEGEGGSNEGSSEGVANDPICVYEVNVERTSEW